MKNILARKIDLLPGWLSLHEGQFLHKAAHLMKQEDGVIVEIGSFQGKSTICLALTNQKVFAIDPHRGDLDRGTKIPPTLTAFNKNIKSFKVENNITLIRKTSQDAVQNWNKKIKLLFIDGLHDKKNAGFDYKKWSPFLVDGGIIAMHDSFCGWEGAQIVALKNIILNDCYYEVGVVGSIIYGIKGQGDFATILNRKRIRLLISVAFWLDRKHFFSNKISFFLIHRVIKLLLLNRFTINFLQ